MVLLKARSKEDIVKEISLSTNFFDADLIEKRLNQKGLVTPKNAMEMVTSQKVNTSLRV